MHKKITSFEKRARRQRTRLRARANQPVRLSVHRSDKHIYAQIIDDSKGHTIVSASSHDEQCTVKSNTVDGAKLVGKLIAEKAIKANVQVVYFDRGAYLFKGRVQALADAAREAGLKF